MLHIALYEPEIPPNTGNAMRLAANTGAQLHLIAPLGFVLEDKLLRRAGLDYRDQATVHVHDGWPAFSAWLGERRLWALTTRARRCYSAAQFAAEDVLLFGPESRGLPAALLDSLSDEQKLRLPMVPDSRSLNLSNSVAVVVYEAWRQMGFTGAV
ncbi:tRNA (cytidine(34)-2'-O)-methyltransferase [Alcanivorax quisquiliarum]|uniref:tRNA (cytidine(34)-2'-O)-methyltransferase n=1 Tax=Alcanivorax quisquiliarum TaxID=2933565 RepID=A0ABT0E5R2_9GAMM|nr:tRNA (cytidine(34)-2'-O)-methyltransferase [Alcanivorax quisquiliarum]MCK0537154.1 tRNA (cytidine(34)-2'-O)-methyltransferase [Alcanivorax quisquiliarum]